MEFVVIQSDQCKNTELVNEIKSSCIFNKSLKETEHKESNCVSKILRTEINISPNVNNTEETINSKGKCLSIEKLYKYSPKSIDYNVFKKTPGVKERTIFDDAEYFSKNYLYKLLPITFENFDETIIHTEHNYCHVKISSSSEAEDDCSRTMDYNQIREKNYKKRKTKFKEEILESKSEKDRYIKKSSISSEVDFLKCNNWESSNFIYVDPKNLSVQAVDMSKSLVEGEKTDHPFEEEFINNVCNITKNQKHDSGNDKPKSDIKLIEVTISRPDEKENYQPCDMFLNDIARLVPKLIEKNCSKIDIQDLTSNDQATVQRQRLYYVISQSTWHLFKSAKERIILTNDKSLGQPVVKQEKNEKPTFLIFDKLSLARYLDNYCKEIGGCFEYSYVEEVQQEVKQSPKTLLERLLTSGIEKIKKVDDVLVSQDVNECMKSVKMKENEERAKFNDKISNEVKTSSIRDFGQETFKCSFEFKKIRDEKLDLNDCKHESQSEEKKNDVKTSNNKINCQKLNLPKISNSSEFIKNKKEKNLIKNGKKFIKSNQNKNSKQKNEKIIRKHTLTKINSAQSKNEKNLKDLEKIHYKKLNKTLSLQNQLDLSTVKGPSTRKRSFSNLSKDAGKNSFIETRSKAVESKVKKTHNESVSSQNENKSNSLTETIVRKKIKLRKKKLPDVLVPKKEGTKNNIKAKNKKPHESDKPKLLNTKYLENKDKIVKRMDMLKRNVKHAKTRSGKKILEKQDDVKKRKVNVRGKKKKMTDGKIKALEANSKRNSLLKKRMKDDK